MEVTDADGDAVIADVRRVTSPLGKLIGLRGRRAGRRLFSFARDTRAPIDMLGVLGPLDLAFIDADHRIIETARAVPVTLHPRTWRLYRPAAPYRHLLEVPAGTLAKRGIAAGSRLRFRD